MGCCAIRDVLDEGRTQITPRPLGGPFRDRIDGRIIVAVDAQRGNTEAVSARRKCPRAAASNALKCGDGPLVVDDVEDDGGLVGRGKPERGGTGGLMSRAGTDTAY